MDATAVAGLLGAFFAGFVAYFYNRTNKLAKNQESVQDLLLDTAGKLNDAEREIDTLKTKLAEQSTQLQSKDVELAKMEGQVSALTALLNSERQSRYADDVQRATERAKLNQKVEIMEGELDKLKAQIYTLGQANDALAQAKVEAENRARVLIEHSKTLEASNARLKVERDELEIDRNNWRAKYDEVVKRLNELETELKSLKADHITVKGDAS